LEDGNKAEITEEDTEKVIIKIVKIRPLGGWKRKRG